MHRDQELLRRLSTEARLLLLAAGPASMKPEIAALLASNVVSWPAFLEVADRERATGVVWRRLREHALPALTDQQRAAFERAAMVSDFTASYLEQRIGESMALLARRGTRGLLLKGAALAVSVYGSFADRPMGDVDLVVDRDRAEDAFEALQSIGWRWNASEYPRSRYGGHHHFPPLLDARGMDVRLELHVELFVEGSPFALDAARLWEDSREVTIGAGTARIPSPEHLLLHSCIHYMWSHMMLFGAWRSFRDVVALSTAGLDWDRFVADARRHRAESACFWTLRLAERLAGAMLPPEVMSRLERATSPRWIDVCERHAAREMFPSEDHCPSQWLRRRLWELSIRPKAAGHGAARPWLLDDMAPENVRPEQRDGGVRRMVRQVPRLGAWVRYARALLG
ncbi:MAG: nucleotidyltransferase family protein [Gemmatimonadetes bacterium]|nr:nucleotidyltransferase family protein [Gemmatimonadota bacterium]MCC6774450.1 nucleotidyltransferase family protein [Gemmatimonadaceae bacterium]